ncbi:hypothetical protein EKH57_12830 [Halorubrum sp. BOL3-1]|uniref:homing endonuclease associated repeat-containing protein n=1 Tax=Halorubrum sp. BOL3-1 TaxID=2497325 RepID=UPI001004F515|nr:hypothetical protein [Halorubrum sp. BOL3-1]QAU13523.1 hypothetical protein EKH57_12830 [Halorubrum sp. BOL3-1]
MKNQTSISEFLPDSGSKEETFNCEICGRVFDSNKGRGIHRGKSHSEDEIKEAMIEELQKLATEQESAPTQRDMNQCGRFSVKTYQDKFGSWNESLRQADLSVNKQSSVTDSELLAELRRLYDKIGETPTSRDMAEKGNYAPSTYSIAFGTWNSAIQEAGLELGKQREIPASKLIDELQRLADDLGEPPTVHQMEERGQFGASTYSTEFGSWNEALREANLGTNKEGNIDDSDLLDEIQRLKREHKKVPTASEMSQYGRFAVTTYNRSFGSWNEALREAGFAPNNRNDIPKPELLREISRLADEIGHTPTAVEMERDGEFGWATYRTAFGSWNATLREAGFDINNRTNIPRSELITELKSVQEQVGRTPGRRDMDRYGQFDSTTHMSTFDTWNEALKAADIEPTERRDIPRSDLIEELKHLGEELGRTPTRSDMNENGAFSGSVYTQRFGSWSSAIVASGFDPNKKYDPEHLDHIVRSTWEIDVAEMLLNADIDYEYESMEISYGNGRTYTPDFVTNKYVIEVKGHLYDRHQVIQKAKAAMDQLNEREYIVIGTEIPANIHIPWDIRYEFLGLLEKSG